MFDRIGVITYAAKVASAEAIFEAAVESGASNAESSAEQHEVTCDPDDFSAVRDALTEKFGDPLAASLTWRPQTTVGRIGVATRGDSVRQSAESSVDGESLKKKKQ